MPKIVISYRRQDSEAIAGRIRDRLAGHYGAESVFMDIDSIPFGTDFREHIRQVLTTTDVVIAIIGPRWTGAGRGRSARIREPTDPVRIEVERALENGTPLVPVLVNGAHMPKPEDLPETLQDLSYRNAAEVDSGRDFHQHMDRLIRSLDQLLATRPAPQRAETAAAAEAPEVAADRGMPASETTASDNAAPAGSAAPPETAPPPAATPATAVAALPPASSPRRWPLFAAIAAILALIVLVAAYLYLQPPGGSRTAVADKPAPVIPPDQRAAAPTLDTSCKRRAGAAFYDEFKSPDGGWGQAGDTKFFKDGRMVLRPKADGATSWIYFPLLFSKKIVVCSEITAPPEIRSAEGDAAGGVMFWAADYDNYYVAEIYLNGSYSVWRRLAGKWIAVVPRRPGSSLRAGPGMVNQVTIAAGGQEATLSINGTETVRFWGQPPGRGGAVGLFGQSETDAASEWRFASIAVVEDKQDAAPVVPASRAAFLKSCEENAAAVFTDDFASPDPGWGASSDTRSFKDGTMALKPKANAGVSWLYAPLLFKRGVVCADVKSPPAVKSREGLAKGGVVFWGIDSRNFYVAEIYVDGSYAVYRYIDGRWANVLPRAKAASIRAGEDQVNRVKVAFDGNSATLAVNDSTIARLQRGQPPPAGGTVGLYAESEADAENQWSFLRIAVLEDTRPAATPSAAATASLAPACKAAAPAAFSDDFKAPDPGWGKSGPDYYFADSQMVLRPKADSNVAWIYLPLVFADGSVCAEVKSPAKLKNTQDVASAGVIFWAADYQNYYLASIFTDSTYTVRRKIAGKWYTVVARSPAASIRLGPGALNQIMVTTAGSRATLTINDARIIGFWGQGPSKGGAVGLYGQSETEQDDEWRFLDIAAGNHAPGEAGFPAAAQAAAKACKPEASPAFFDDFTTPDPGWGSPGATYYFKDGRMVLKPKPSLIEPWIYPALIFNSAAICADITLPPQTAEAATTAAAGIIFWASDYKNYHVAQLYADGTYSIWQKIDGDWATVIPRTASPAIRQGPGALNRVKLVLDRNAVTLVVNEASVIAFHGQPREAGGSVGLYAGSGKGAESEWRFANLVVVD